MNAIFPTSDETLNAVLAELVTSSQSVLGDNFISAYLQGSFGVGDWDVYSDVDFLIAVEHDLSEEEVSALQAMHLRLFHLESDWAKHLEGSYFPKALLRRSDPARTPLWYLDNTADKLILSDHDNSLVVRWVVRERGITLAGPDARELIDPVPVDQLRQEVVDVMHDWGGEILTGKYKADNRWAQPFAVLSYCRMLHTLHTGTIESKPSGVQWAMSSLESRWHDLIRRAWDDRPNPSLKVHQAADPEDVKYTLEFIRYAIDLAGERGWKASKAKHH